MKKIGTFTGFLTVLLLFLLQTSVLSAAGSSARGWAIVQVTKLESSGLFFKSFEGELRIASYDPDEECEKENCFSPIVKEIEFSIDPDNEATARFMNDNIGREMVIHYNIHRIAPFTLGTSFEILNAYSRRDSLLEGMERKHSVEQSGSKRNYSLYGRVLRLEERGLTVRTYEGIYYDKQNGKVAPISISEKSMARYIFNTMFVKKEYYMGISEARVSVARETLLDIFEINYDSRPDTL